MDHHGRDAKCWRFLYDFDLRCQARIRRNHMSEDQAVDGSSVYSLAGHGSDGVVVAIGVHVVGEKRISRFARLSQSVGGVQPACVRIGFHKREGLSTEALQIAYLAVGPHDYVGVVLGLAINLRNCQDLHAEFVVP